MVSLPRSRFTENSRNNNRENNQQNHHRGGKRRGRSDDSIIRGAAILRDHIRGLDDSLESTRGGEHEDQPLTSKPTTGSRATHSTTSLEEEEESNFSDPFAQPQQQLTPYQQGIQQHSTGGGRPARPVSPQQDDTTFGFESHTAAGETFGSGSRASWANQALSEDVSVSMSVLSNQSRQPDCDPCDPLSPQRSSSLSSKRKPVGVAKVATYNLVNPIVSLDEDEESHTFDDLAERDYSYDTNEDEVPVTLVRKPSRSKEKTKKKGDRNKQSSSTENRQARILQLVTTNDSSDLAPPPPEDDEGDPPPPKTTTLQKAKPATTTTKNDVDNVSSPLSVEYFMLIQDPAYLHAQKAGHLWQSLVGSQIRFPSAWWNGARSPPMGLEGKPRPWQFFGRYPSYNPNLRRYVKHRSAPGRLLLHIVVQDLVTWRPVQDIVVGCFDPNSRGIRKSEKVRPGREDCRELWLAVRKRTDSISVIDSLLAQGRSWVDKECKGPLGPQQRITNSNVRAVFGEEPPAETIFVHESTLYERLVAGKDQGPPLFLVQEFVFC